MANSLAASLSGRQRQSNMQKEVKVSLAPGFRGIFARSNARLSCSNLFRMHLHWFRRRSPRKFPYQALGGPTPTALTDLPNPCEN